MDGVPHAAQRVAERPVAEGERHADAADAQIRDRVGERLLRHVQQPQDRLGQSHAQGEKRQGGDQGGRGQRSDRLLQIVVPPGSHQLRDEDAAAGAQGDAGRVHQNGDVSRVRDGRHAGAVGKTPHDGQVDQRVQRVKEIGKHIRQGKDQQLPKHISLRKIPDHGFSSQITASLDTYCQHIVPQNEAYQKRGNDTFCRSGANRAISPSHAAPKETKSLRVGLYRGRENGIIPYAMILCGAAREEDTAWKAR